VALCLVAMGPWAHPRASLAEPGGSTGFAVSVVPSDDASLTDPLRRDEALTADQVMAMVRRAVDLVGGMTSAVPDTARLVVIKPNVGMVKPSGSGLTTDVRLVRAVALLVHEVAPWARIVIGEGGGWVTPGYEDSTDAYLNPEQIVDGFEVAGYRDMVADLRQRGVDVDCLDLNFDRSYTLRVPGGGLATDEYDIAASIIDADAWINCPVAKIHGAKITCCMKNRFGVLPGRLYGWSKSSGTRHHAPMPHAPRIIDEAFVDIWMLTEDDLCVVDMLVGSEDRVFDERTTRRSNIVLAGHGPVSTDLVVARLMGFNPDDLEFPLLARQRGLGPGTIDRVEVRGGDPGELAQRFVKATGYHGEWQEQAIYGMGPRHWTLLGPKARDHTFTPDELSELAPTPGEAGWSPIIWFGHDKIDLDKHFGDPTECAVYAFTHFTMARADSVRFWLGSDEGLEIWIDGECIYPSDSGRRRVHRRHRLGQVRLPGYVEAGEHRLVVRAEQGRGRFDFSFNICEPIDDHRYAGNRYPGVRYHVTPSATEEVAALSVRAEDTFDRGWGGYPTHSESTLEALPSRALPDSLPSRVQPLTAAAPTAAGVVSAMVAASGAAPDHLDDLTRQCLSRLPFGMAPMGFAHETLEWMADSYLYGPDLGRIAGWLGYRYHFSYGYGRRESLKGVMDWLASGRAVIAGTQRGWRLVTGFRSEGRELFSVRPQVQRWVTATDDWWGVLPGGERVNCPVLVVAPGDAAIPARALADSLAVVAVEMALYPESEVDGDRLGTQRVPLGLDAWEAWTVEWEALSLTPEWGQTVWQRRQLARLRQRVVDLASDRHLAADYLEREGVRAPIGTRSRAFTRAGREYRGAAGALEELAGALPRERWGELTPDDARRLRSLPQTRGLVRRAWEHELEAVGALAWSSAGAQARYRERDLPEPPPEGPTTAGPRSVEPSVLHLRTRIDGHDTIHIRGTELWYEHHAWDLPGRHGGRDDPTLVNGQAWYPEWDEGEGISDRYTGWQPALPLAELESVRLIVSDGRNPVSVDQRPAPENEHTLSVRIDDYYGGAAWYDVAIEWSTSPAD